MRLISASVKNYRIHKEFNIDFDPEMTIIAGPNETGKSTFIEAVHRALFLKAKSSGKELERMRSKLYGGYPEVEVCFEARGKRCEIKKIFKGNAGTAVLKIDGKVFYNEEAEYRLGEFLGEEPVGGKAANMLMMRWGHIWVWQGRSGEDPSSTVRDKNDYLIRRLQQEQGAIVQQSEKDAAVVKYFQQEYSKFFTPKGQISKRKGNELYEKQQRYEKLKALVEEARSRVERLILARNEYVKAVETEKEAQKQLQTVHYELSQVAAKLAEVEKLITEVKEHETKLKELEQTKSSIEKLDQEIAELKQKISEIESDLGPKEKKIKELESELGIKQKRLDELRSSEYQTLRNQINLADIELKVLNHCKDSLRATMEIDELKKKVERIDELEKRKKELERSLAQLPDITDLQRNRLLELSSEIKTAQARLDALSTRIEVVNSDLQVKVDGKIIPVGGHATISSTADITVGDATKITVIPGGGTTLSDVVNEIKRLEEELENLLNALGVDSIEKALSVYETVREQKNKLNTIKASLEELNGPVIRKSLEEAELVIERTEAEIKRLAQKLTDWKRPDDLSEALKKIQKVDVKLQSLKDQENLISKKIAELDEYLRRIRHDKELIQQEINKLKEALTEAKAKLQVKQEEAGDDKARARQLLEIKVQIENEIQVIQSLNKQIKSLDPDSLETRRAKLEEALKKLNESINSARESKLRAETTLELDGSVDPEAELEDYKAQLALAQQEYEAVLHRAYAIRLIYQLFLEEQQQLADRYSKPLSEKISSYAKMIFGGLSKVESRLSETNVMSISLIHQKLGNTEFEFELLSGGAREQLAAAVRLAVAEILAEEHDGCLPIVFDDSFTNSDHYRLPAIQDMLFKATKKGLQIIVLTSNTDDYGSMPGKIVTMASPLEVKPAFISHEAIEDNQKNYSDIRANAPFDANVSAAPINLEGFSSKQELFLNTLKLLGGGAGNKNMMAELRWDRRTYEEVKSSLLEIGKIKTGRGRGGSVSLI